MSDEKTSPELATALQKIALQMGFAQPEPVQEKKEETKDVKVDETKPVVAKDPAVKEKDDDITTWSDEQLEILATSKAALAKDAQAILNKRGVDGFQSEETKQIEALRKDLSRERTETNKAEAARHAAEDHKALENRVRNGDNAAMTELLGNRLPVGGSLTGQIDMKATLLGAAKLIEAENKAKANKGVK